MISSKSPLAFLLQGVLVGYLLVSLVYTSSYLIASPVASAILGLVGITLPGSSSAYSVSEVMPRVDLIAHARQMFDFRQASLDLKSSSKSWNLASHKDLLYWNLPSLGSYNGALDVSAETFPIQEDTFLSKAFAQALHPTELIPFYYKATSAVNPSDVTITTLVTSNRYKVLKQLVERYQGPISVTIHIPLPPPLATASETSQFIAAVKDLNALYVSSPHFATYVDVHLALSPLSSTAHSTSDSTEGGRQFNIWRNVARLFARSEFVMMLDVDFAVCTDWRGFVRDAVQQVSSAAPTEVGSELPAPTPSMGNGMPPEVVQKLREGTAALVIPAFEYRKQEDGVDQTKFPTNKEVCMVCGRFHRMLNSRTVFRASSASRVTPTPS